MPFKISEARKHLQAFDLSKLFRQEMGWDSGSSQKTAIQVEGEQFTLSMVAHKRGVVAFLCSPRSDGSLPDYRMRCKIETQARKLAHEHLIIFTNHARTVQKWQWVRREPGKPIARREYDYTSGQKGDALLHRLQTVAFDFGEEEDLTIIEVNQRVKKAFDVERVTKRFYERFKSEHSAFLKFLKGIPDEHFQRWYVSVMLNRLMFLYFIQKKGFLNGDVDYLRHHLEQSLQAGQNQYYRNFLCPLFFEGLAQKQSHRSLATNKLLGNIPYLNGGIFEMHQIEERYGQQIEIPDDAFQKLFEFFDLYRWHLDERPLRQDDEINPDVLGYIFEKYINQKQMGAYYTKEDITEYISKNTIIPHIFDTAQKECKIAFEGDGSVWRLLAEEPDRYIYEAVRHGAGLPLPDEIAVGLADPKQRQGWNKPAPDGFALPTEIWREVVARRQRYQEVKEKLSSGSVTSINDLISLNLDIRQFAQDVIEDSDPDLLTAFWKALTNIKILDPTVGSGAFLFAALNILEPMYEACLERMNAFVQELDASGEKHSPKKFEHFRRALAQVAERPNQSYFVYKSIIINNLYGVDIMDEAIEICKLRLFLKLAAQVEPDSTKENLGIEPLPDIDFNIRAGNTLVGFATREDVKRSVQTGTLAGVQTDKLFAMPEDEDQLALIDQKAGDIDRLYKAFRAQQTLYGGEVEAEDKKKLEIKLYALDEELNNLLSRQYAVTNPKSEAYKKWLVSHKPFHWFVEFYGIMSEGGFDIIIGNPPYVEYGKVRRDYTVLNYTTESANNLYAYCMERGLNILHPNGSFGMIVPVSSISGESYLSLFKLFINRTNWISSFSNRPAKLFQGVEQRLAIFISRDKSNGLIHSTPYQHWYESERNRLFPTLYYGQSPTWKFNGFPIKSGFRIPNNIFIKLTKKDDHNLTALTMSGNYGTWVHNGPTYWVRALPFEPKENVSSEHSNHYRKIEARTKDTAYLITSILNSSIFYFFFKMISNCRDLGKKEWANFPIGIIDYDIQQDLVSLGNKLEVVLQQTASKKARQYPSGYIEYFEYYPARGKSVIDEIDKVLARHYQLNEEELDFIINYDIKYRMGEVLEEDE